MGIVLAIGMAFITQYELKSDKAYMMNAILKREDEADKQLKTKNLKEL